MQALLERIFEHAGGHAAVEPAREAAAD
jgi:hypothetical protein